MDGCTVDARADGAGVTGECVAGVIAGGMAARGGGRVVIAGAAHAAGARAYGVYLQGACAGDGPAGCGLSVVASWLDATGADGGVGCAGGSLVSARFVTPAGGAFGAGGVVDASGTMAPHVVIEPQGNNVPAGETDGCEVPGGAGPAVEQPGAGSATDPALKPATTTPKTTVTRTTVSAPSKAKTASAATATLPKTADDNWIAASLALFLLGTALIGRCLPLLS